MYMLSGKKRCFYHSVLLYWGYRCKICNSYLKRWRKVKWYVIRIVRPFSCVCGLFLYIMLNRNNIFRIPTVLRNTYE